VVEVEWRVFEHVLLVELRCNQKLLVVASDAAKLGCWLLFLLFVLNSHFFRGTVFLDLGFDQVGHFLTRLGLVVEVRHYMVTGGSIDWINLAKSEVWVGAHIGEFSRVCFK
jgi:hypothetical protein